jgi:hypothetical protein
MATIKDIALEGPEHYHSWFSNIKGSVPEDLWKYFDLETADEYIEPQAVTFATVHYSAYITSKLYIYIFSIKRKERIPILTF